MSAVDDSQQSDAVTAQSLAEHRMYVLFYPVGSRRWNIRQRPNPNSTIVGVAPHGKREMVCEECIVDNVRWLHLTSGGWVRDRDPGFMEWRWPDNPGATGYYGWHPSELVSDKVIAAAEDNWTVPVNIGIGSWHSGFSYMAHPDRRWAAVHVVLLALLLLVVLLLMRNTIITGCRMLMG